MTDTNTLLGWLNQFVTHRRIDEVMDGADYEAVQDMNTHLRAQEARIAALTKDAERLKCFNQIWRWKALKDGEIIYQYGEHVPALFQKTAELLPTHQPAPDYTDLLKMIAHRARSFPNFPLGHHITEVFAAIGEEPPEPAPAPAPELKPLSLDEIHQRYKNLRGNEPPHYIDIYRDAEAALGILRGGL
mgnify:CR=1 FL=1